MIRSLAARSFVLLALSLALLAPGVTRAQAPADPAKILGQTRDAGSLPFWSKPAAEDVRALGDKAQAMERGVFLVGYSKNHGTAWVVSKQHRLLVTNAHVADIIPEAGGKMLAIPNGTSQVYRVERAWYHPGVRRFFQGNGDLSIRSSDPNEGPIDPLSPDLAVLQLAAEGPALEVEFPVATPEELSALFARPIAIMGFPGHDTHWPGLGEKAAATYDNGVVQRVTDFRLNPSSPPEELQFVQHSAPTWGGFSGSPIFLASGRVAAIHNMSRTVKRAKGDDVEVKSIPHGIRADCLLELLVHAGLDDKVPFAIDKSKVNVARWTNPDAHSEKIRTDYAEATKMMHQALAMNRAKDRAGAIRKLSEAIQLVPTHALAISWRAEFYLNSWADSEGWTREQELQVLGYAETDCLKALRLEPNDIDYIIQRCRIINAYGWYNHAIYEKSLTVLNKVLDQKLTPYLRIQALTCRGNIYGNTGHVEEAIRDYNEAIRVQPGAYTYYRRAGFWEHQGRSDLARADRAKAAEYEAKE